MLAGMMGARAISSMAMILFGLNALWDVNPKNWLKKKWWLFGCAWVLLLLLSGLWSADKHEWWEHTQVKMPFLLLPLAFDFLPPFSKLQRFIFTAALAALMTAGAIYSLSHFFTDPVALIDSYKYAQILPTPFYNDHIAFSAAVAASIVWMLCYFPQLPAGISRWLFGICIGFLIAYLHILAAKTGLLALYLFLFVWIIRQIIRRPARGFAFAAAILTLIVAAAVFVPTLRERIGYSIVTWRSMAMGERGGIYSDASRIISYDLAMRSIAKHPFIGVGIGDVFDEMKRGYSSHYPEVAEAQMLWPHNQYLTTAMGIGIPGMLLLLCWQVAALRRLKGRDGFYFGAVWLMLLVPLFVDPFFEVQIGVAVYLIYLLWQRKAMKDAALAESQHERSSADR